MRVSATVVVRCVAKKLLVPVVPEKGLFHLLPTVKFFSENFLKSSKVEQGVIRDNRDRGSNRHVIHNA